MGVRRPEGALVPGGVPVRMTGRGATARVADGEVQGTKARLRWDVRPWRSTLPGEIVEPTNGV